jgi:hypothetical protein
MGQVLPRGAACAIPSTARFFKVPERQRGACATTLPGVGCAAWVEAKCQGRIPGCFWKPAAPMSHSAGALTGQVLVTKVLADRGLVPAAIAQPVYGREDTKKIEKKIEKYRAALACAATLTRAKAPQVCVSASAPRISARGVGRQNGIVRSGHGQQSQKGGARLHFSASGGGSGQYRQGRKERAGAGTGGTGAGQGGGNMAAYACYGAMIVVSLPALGKSLLVACEARVRCFLIFGNKILSILLSNTIICNKNVGSSSCSPSCGAQGASESGREPTCDLCRPLQHPRRQVDVAMLMYLLLQIFVVY